MPEIESIYATIGHAIQSERDALGFSQSDLAQELGLTRTSVTNIEAGRQRLQVHTLYRIACALAIPVTALLPRSRDCEAVL